MIPFSQRQPYVAGTVLLSLPLLIGAGIAVPAAFGFDIQAMAHPGSIVDKGEGVAQLLRWGALLDMVSYLPFAVIVVYVHYQLRERNPELVALLTACGLGYVLIGSIAGALLASAGPPLIEGYAAATAEAREAARVTLEALGHVSLVGLWGTLELIVLGFWFLGVGWLLRRDWRPFAMLSVIVGLGVLASSVRTGLTGHTIVEVDGPIALAILAASSLLFVWELWLVVRLWRGSTD